MNITPQILSIPPYLSTAWKNIVSLRTVPRCHEFDLIVVLADSMQVTIPNLEKQAVDAIFEAHAKYSVLPGPAQPPILQPRIEAFSLPLGSGDFFNSAMQHNPSQADAPEFPKEILEKIAGIAKVLGMEDSNVLPKPEPDCNCPYCQIARAFYPEEHSREEEISAEDLQFRNWDIKQSADKLYLVFNPLDKNEHYSVFLGEPLGCTCGQKNCEHIRAVLNS